jgi:hypothetical protein
MPNTYESELHEIESAKLHADLAYEKEKDKLYWKPLFNKSQMDYWEERYEESKMKKWFYIGFGFAWGCILTIVIIHYT